MDLEFDSIAVARGGSDEGGQCRRLLAELLLQLTHNKHLHGSHNHSNYETIEQKSSNSTENQDMLIHKHHDNGNQMNIHDGDATHQLENHYHTPASMQLHTNNAIHENRVVVIAATNRIEDLDAAILRRFEAKVYIGAPDAQSRHEMFAHFMKGVSHSLSSEQVSALVDKTNDWSGSEIEVFISYFLFYIIYYDCMMMHTMLGAMQRSRYLNL